MNTIKFTGAAYREHKDFWENRISRTDVPFSLQKGTETGDKKNCVLTRTLNIPDELAGKIKDNKQMAFVYTLAVLALTLRKFESVKKVMLATPKYIKGNSENEERLVFLDVDFKDLSTVADLLNSTTKTIKSVYSFQDYPFIQLLNTPYKTYSNIEFSFSEIHQPHHQPGNSDYTLSASLKNGKIEMELQTSVSCNSIAESLLSSVEFIFAQFTKNETRLADVLPAALPVGLNIDLTPPEQTIIKLFEEQVKLHADAIAVTDSKTEWTYAQLNERANKIARLLIKRGVKKGQAVPVIHTRNADMVACLLAILKAGAYYVPIDPSHPVNRIEFIIKDSAARFVLSDNAKTFDLKNYPSLNKSVTCIFIEEEETEIGNMKPADPRLKIAADSLAYLIYTSGTTGIPKGVMIENRNVVSLFKTNEQLFDFNQSDVWTVFHSFSFDFSVWEMYGALLYGGKMLVLDDAVRKNPAAFSEVIRDEKVTVLNQTPSAFYTLLAEGDKDSLAKLKYVIFGGEALDPSRLQHFKSLHPHVKLINMYGITETTVHTTLKEIKKNDTLSACSNIGVALPSLKVFVVNDELQILPKGITGQLVVQGMGLAKGYFNREDLTKEKFVDSPFNSFKMYLSGDRGRLIENGEIEYRGRNDDQFKIRGYRIEKGEIEHCLKKIAPIENAVVDIRKNTHGETEMLAFYVATEQLNEKEIKTELLKNLPEYMIPQRLARVPFFPLTVNGKIDLKSLIIPDEKSEANSEENLSATEKKILEVWRSVLNRSEINIHDNFYLLGGHSLLAVKIAGILKNLFKIDLDFTEVFSNLTIAELGRVIDSKEIVVIDEPAKAPVQDVYELSRAQERMWIVNQTRGGEQYNVFNFFEITGSLDVKAFLFACNELIKRHDGLRTTFPVVDGKAVQKINSINNWPHTPEYFDYRNTADKNDRVQKFIAQRRSHVFDLANGPLYTVILLQLENEKFLLSASFYHIIIDMLSVQVLADELKTIYNEVLLRNEFSHSLPDLKLQYADFSYWHNQVLASEKIKIHQDYFLEKFSGEIPVLDLPKDHNRKNNDTIRSEVINFSLANDIKEKLVHFNANNNSTTFMSLLTVFKSLLFRYTGQTDLIVGTPLSGREHTALDKVVGVFINTLALRSVFDTAFTFKQLLETVKKTTLEAFQHQVFPFDRLVGGLNLNRVGGHHRFFDVFFVSNDGGAVFPEDEITLKDAVIKPYANDAFNSNKFQISVYYQVKEDAIDFMFTYDADLFSKSRIENMISSYRKLLNGMLQETNAQVTSVEIVSEKEYEEQYSDFNNTLVPFSSGILMHSMFEKIASQTGHLTALRQDGRSVSYAELNKSSNKLAHFLITNGLKNGQTAGLICDRNFNMIIGMLAILKAGGTYVPIDPEYPEERKKYILENAEVKLVIAENNNLIFNAEGITFFSLAVCETEKCPDHNPSITKDPSDLAYIIYTSGSTGRPKGVMIEHRSAVNLIEWVNNYFKVVPGDNLLFITSMCFDLSVYDIFGILSAGATIVIARKEEIQDIAMLKEMMRSEKITFWDSVPSTLNFFISELESADGLFEQTDLRLVFMSGDWIPVNLPARITNYFPSAKVISLGGATEGTVWSNFFPVEKTDKEWTSIPYGKPMQNNFFYILDDQLKPVPKGVKGELFIGGIGVSRGYMNDAAKTTHAFLPDPFNKTLGGMMYRTGDIGRFMNDGNMEFLGRKDFQVKIRGFRVELGEIETAILNYAGVKACVVTAIGEHGKTKELCAYVAGIESQQFAELRNEIKKILPDYMIPTHFICLDKIPLTSNGKIDKKSLPDPQLLGLKIGTEYVAPKNETEEKLVKLWQEILENKNIGIKDNFFELGGHSLKVTRLVNLIYKNFSVNIKLADLFSTPVLEDQARLIEKSKKSLYKSISKAKKKDLYPLSSAQKRLYFLHEFAPDSTGYNMPMVHYLGKTADYERLNTSIRKLIERHESLRTTFEKHENNIYQKIHPLQNFILDTHNCARDEFEDFMNHYIRPFDLTTAPLLRSALVNVKELGFVWVIDLHHIISDGASQAVLREDFMRFYNDEKLPELRIQYKDFSEWQNKMNNEGEFENQKQYWLAQFSSGIPRLNLPADHARPAVFNFKGADHQFLLNKDTTDKLRAFTMRNQCTLQMALLSVLNVLFNKYTAQEDFVIGCGIAGRRHTDLDRLAGMFVNTLAIRNFPEGEKVFADFLKEVSSCCIAAYENQDIQFEDLVDMLNTERDPSRNPVFDICLVVQNTGSSQAAELSLTNNSTDQSPDDAILTYGTKTSKFDMTWFVFERGNEIQISIEYYTAIFERKSIERFAAHFTNILNTIMEQPHVLISDINPIDKTETSFLLNNYVSGKAMPYADETIHVLFDRQCQATPLQIAITDNFESLSYAELNERSNRIANFLINETGITKGACVGILQDRSCAMMVSVLGVLKAGGVYVPLESSYPEERLLYMLTDAGVKILLVEKRLIESGNRLQWRCSNIEYLVCADSENIYHEQSAAKSALMGSELWDHVGEKATDQIMGGGWMSSYTGDYLTEKEMKEYSHNACSKLEPFLFKEMKVLEIGCSSGLTMFEIAPKVSEYIGTDLSSAILANTQQMLEQKGHRNISLHCMPAHETDQLDIENIDLVIINSVVQCFNGHNYFRDVITKVLRKMKPTGIIFLGDIMDEDKRELLIRDMEEFRQNNTGKSYRTKTDWSAELFLSKTFIKDLVAENAGIVDVTFTDKIHTIENELTRYRFDAVLKIDKTATAKQLPKQKKQKDLRQIFSHSASVPASSVTTTDAAYIIYTSGSTGNPKGVIVKHKGVINLCNWHQVNFKIESSDRTSVYAGVGFDASVWETFPYLLKGAQLCVIPDDIRLNVQEIS
ncbi:MAG: amino acid adenylation domain-containing protein, partial [Bacteroidia bacterium]|nr:amino acid adenylation domain-containing protein [Bacteroidia bacterium]